LNGLPYIIRWQHVHCLSKQLPALWVVHFLGASLGALWISTDKEIPYTRSLNHLQPMKMIALSTRAEKLSVRISSIRNVSGKIDKSATWRSVLINSSSAVSLN